MSIVIALRGGQAPGQGHRIEGTMSHDKIRAAARKRMAQTGEPYTAARRAVANDHQGTGGTPSPQTGYALRMSGEIRGWLAGLRGSNPRAARRVAQTLAALMEEGAGLGDPLVTSTAGSWSWALLVTLDLSYQERLERLTAVRRGEADAAALVKEIQDHAAELESARATLETWHRHAVDAGRQQEAEQAASHMAAARRQAAELRRKVPAVIDARNRLAAISRQAQARVDAYRTRKEVLKATYIAAEGSLRVHQTIAASGLAGDDGGQQHDDPGEAIRAAQAGLADATARIERELGIQSWPEGLLELRPGAPVHGDIRILFAAEPPATAVLIAVLEGPGVAGERFGEAVMAAADALRQVRAGQAPEATAHGYDSARRFLEEFDPGSAGSAGTLPATPREEPGTRD